MNICSIEFLSILVFASAVFFWLPTVRLRQSSLALMNAGFLGSVLSGARAWALLGLFLASGYLVARALLIHPRRSIAALYVLLLIAVFLILKRYEFLTAILPGSVFAYSVSIVGLSYMLFRQIHVVIDVLQGQIKHLSLWTYANYQLSLFGLLAGPIQRYEDFEKAWDSLEPQCIEWRDSARAYLRLFFGVIKVVLLAGASLSVYDWASASFESVGEGRPWRVVVNFLLLFYAYPAYIYFNFSGYCDVVIAGASQFGIRMPENFNYPFLSRNLIDFWTRWHKTLGLWIRDYVFTPAYKALATHWPTRAASLAFLCYFLAFFLAGVWHGSTMNFVIYGLLNGIGVSAAKLWETWLIRRFGRKGFSAYLHSRPIKVLCIAATFQFVCFTMFFFPADLQKSFRILRCLAAQFN